MSDREPQSRNPPRAQLAARGPRAVLAGAAVACVLAGALVGACRDRASQHEPPEPHEPSPERTIDRTIDAPEPSPVRTTAGHDSDARTAPAHTPGDRTTAGHGPIKRARVTILSTMLADAGIGEWGFAALIEVGDRRILFDTGKHPDTVLRNARVLNVDLTRVTDVVLSHHHGDHVGGLVQLRRTTRARAPRAMATVHVAAGMFTPRRWRGEGAQINKMIAIRDELEAIGTRFVVHDRATEIYPGVWVTGPVPRIHDERNWGGARRIPAGERWVEDTLPESQALVIDAEPGLIVISGCGHAGIINTIAHARAHIHDAPVYAAIGGFHLLDADDAHLSWTAAQLADVGLAHFVGAHCTGIEAVFRIRQGAGLARATAVVGAIGAVFSLPGGIDPRALAR